MFANLELEKCDGFRSELLAGIESHAARTQRGAISWEQTCCRKLAP